MIIGLSAFIFWKYCKDTYLSRSFAIPYYSADGGINVISLYVVVVNANVKAMISNAVMYLMFTVIFWIVVLSKKFIPAALQCLQTQSLPYHSRPLEKIFFWESESDNLPKTWISFCRQNLLWESKSDCLCKTRKNAFILRKWKWLSFKLQTSKHISFRKIRQERRVQVKDKKLVSRSQVEVIVIIYPTLHDIRLLKFSMDVAKFETAIFSSSFWRKGLRNLGNLLLWNWCSSTHSLSW